MVCPPAFRNATRSDIVGAQYLCTVLPHEAHTQHCSKDL